MKDLPWMDLSLDIRRRLAPTVFDEFGIVKRVGTASSFKRFFALFLNMCSSKWSAQILQFLFRFDYLYYIIFHQVFSFGINKPSFTSKYE